MLPIPLRAVCALAAIAFFLGGIIGLVLTGNPFWLTALVLAAILAMPAMFGGAKPSADDLQRIEEQLRRFRSAMLLCFAAAAAIYALVITGHARPAWSLGIALWLVAFVLMFFVAYYRTQRRLAAAAR